MPGTSGLPRSLVKLRGRREPAGAAMVESTERAPNPVRAGDEVDDGVVLAGIAVALVDCLAEVGAV